MARSFEDLRVYQAAEELADLAWDIASQWKPLAQDTVGKQLIRAADNKRFVAIARGSLNETRHFLRRAHKRRLLTEQETEDLRAITEALPRALNAYLNSIGRDGE